jgi:hypothetical protein
MKTGMPSSIAEILLANASFVDTPLDARQQIDSARGSSELNDLLGLEEISFLEVRLLESELIQKREKEPRVGRSGTDENIQGPGMTWAPMKCETLRADDDVINAARI